VKAAAQYRNGNMAFCEENPTMPARKSTAGLLFAALAVAACENLPYYDESLDLFSRSRYDPEIKAIDERTPPPQDSPVISAPTDDAAMAPALAGNTMLAGRVDDPVATDPQAATHRAVVPATLPPRPRITPPLGFGRSKRVIYGTNRGPFQTGNVRTFR
jgi:hypothetical protein